MEWVLTDEEIPQIGDNVETSDDGVTSGEPKEFDPQNLGDYTTENIKIDAN